MKRYMLIGFILLFLVVPASSCWGSDLYATFPGTGIWHWNGTAWTQLTPNHPSSMTAAGSALYADFAGYGLYKYDGTTWTQLTPNHPSIMTAADSILYTSFEGYGLWKYNGSVWTQLTPNAPTSMTAAGSALYAGFAGYGLYKYDSGTWTQLTPSAPTSMTASGSMLYATFTGTGIWAWNGSAWTQINTNHPASMTASGSILYADFAGHGIYKYDGTAWTLVLPIDPAKMTAAGSVLYANFTGYGLWKYENGTWTQMTPSDPSSMAALTQPDEACSTLTISPTSNTFPPGIGAGTVTVTASSSCHWVPAVSNSDWLTVASFTTSTGGLVNYSLSANVSNTSRIGQISIGPKIFTVTQSAQTCIFSIFPTANLGVSSNGASGSVQVTASSSATGGVTPDCPWTAVSNVDWIVITSGSSGSGNGTVGYTVLPNTGTSQRTGTITIAGQTFTVTQSPSPPPSSSQVWLLNFGAAPCGAGMELAMVRVTPFTSSGTFSETGDSPGVYIWGPSCTCSYRLQIGGNVVHGNPYDRWDLVNVGGAGCGMQTFCTGSGTANGNFPNATSVNGSMTCTTQSPLGTSTGSGTWQGTMIGN